MENIKKRLELQLQILKLQLQVLLLRQKLTIPNLSGPTHIVVHHAAGDWDFEQVNNSHKERWGFKSSLGFYCGYHYFVGKDGMIYLARRDNEEAAHTIEKGNPGFWNKNSIGICLQGNFEIEEPNCDQLNLLEVLVERKRKEYNIPKENVKGHRDIDATLCPGEHLYKWILGYKGRVK